MSSTVAVMGCPPIWRLSITSCTWRNTDAVPRDGLRSISISRWFTPTIRSAMTASGSARWGPSEQAFDGEAGGLDAFEIGSLDFDAHGGAHAALQHDLARGNGLELGRGGRAGDLGRADDLVPEVVRRADLVAPLPERPPLRIRDQLAVGVPHKRAVFAVVPEPHASSGCVGDVFRFIGDDSFDHRGGRGIERAFDTADLADDQLDPGSAAMAWSWYWRTSRASPSDACGIVVGM